MQEVWSQIHAHGTMDVTESKALLVDNFFPT